MDLQQLPLAKIFWSLLAVEVVAFGVMLVLVFFADNHSPEGPVGGWVLLLLPVIWGILALVFSQYNSPSAQLLCTVLLALPLIHLAVGPAYTGIQRAVWEQGWRGADSFSGAQLTLANAIYDHDVERVKQLIPVAGDLNTTYRNDTTLFDFAISNTNDSDASFEIVRTMLAAGGNPNVPSGRALTLALFRPTRFARLLLDAGADPNALDGARPVWWTVLSAAEDEDLSKLELLLAHGADITLRDREGGPVAWAAYQKAWRAMWLLMERGATWKGEQQFGQTVHHMMTKEFSYRHNDLPDEFRTALAKYEQEASTK